MYKDIINNFIFFKNFNNSDFIIRVILALKPIQASKNERLVNEGDYIEEIIFVQKGRFSLFNHNFCFLNIHVNIFKNNLFFIKLI